ncbi:MAG: hypothetical protein AABY62_06125, partial [Pseudomonadota bacterium]
PRREERKVVFFLKNQDIFFASFAARCPSVEFPKVPEIDPLATSWYISDPLLPRFTNPEDPS